MNASMNVQKLSRSAKDKIAALALLANEDMEGAALGLHSTAVRATELLTLLCRKNPALFTGIAQENFSWPLMYDPHPEGMRESAAFVEWLKLGTQTQVNLSSGKTFSWRVPANVVAIHLHRAARSLRRAPMRSWTGRDWISLAVGAMNLKLDADDPADREKLRRAILDLVAGRKMPKQKGRG